MENEKGLDLSLGLPCGSNTSSHKGEASVAGVGPNEDDRDRKMINEFKAFLEGGNQHSLKFGESYCGQYAAKASVDMETSKSLNTEGGNWGSADFEDEGRSAVCEKRKSMFTKVDPKKKHAAGAAIHGDFPRASHASGGDEGSTGENEDVADSETDGSSSKHVLSNDDASEPFSPSSSLHLGQRDGFGDSESREIMGQKKNPVSSEKELKIAYDVSFPAQPPAAMSAPFPQGAIDFRASGTLCFPNYPFPGRVHAERPSMQPVPQTSFPLTFGYSSAQLPTLYRDNSKGSVSDIQQIRPDFTRNQANVPVGSSKFPGEGKILEHGRQQIEDPSSHMKNDSKDRPGPHQEAIPSDFQAIRPGMAAEIKFGGSGSYPNLPWVSTSSPNPNGRTISGVTYRFSATQIKIVCACHGSHMSPEEFVRHASEDATAPPNSASLLSSNPAASASS